MTMFTSPEARSATNHIAQIRQRLNDLSIGRKLSFGFGTLVVLIGFLVTLSYLASVRAKANFERVTDVRLPSALKAMVIELEMQKMIADVQGYLSLADPRYRESFEQGAANVGEMLHELDSLSAQWNDQFAADYVSELHTSFNEWVILAERMFELRDNPQENQPAVRILSQEARPVEAEILNYTSDLIERQAERNASEDNMRLLKTMADFQSSFNLMTTALDGYVATVELDSKALFSEALANNEMAWDNLNQAVAEMTPEQQLTLSKLDQHRTRFLDLPDRMFAAVEGEHAREDLYLFSNQAGPLADEIVTLFHDVRSEQLYFLAGDIAGGSSNLSTAQTQTIVGAAISIVLAAFLAFAIRRNITGPVMRLTEVTAQIIHGNLDAIARSESKDEIGQLADSFNNMTKQLRETLAQVEHRARLIETSGQVSQRLSTILDEGQLVVEVVERLQSAFGYTHAHLFLCRDVSQDLVLVGGSGQAGQELVEKGFTISSGDGLVGRAAILNKPVLITDVTQDADFLANPLLSETRSELAVPIAIGDQLLGVLDIQHNATGGLTQLDADLLQSIASQVAITLRNARSYAETEHRADQERVINDINQKILGATTIERAMQIAVRELGRSVRAPLTTVHLVNTGSTKTAVDHPGFDPPGI